MNDVEVDFVSEGRHPASGEPERPRRSRKLAEVFGDVLPDTTGDERDRQEGEAGDSWYRENRPPHHG
nr:hypothetical protein [Actinopolyspora biskrensis]